jgi:protein-S-isoprenylcysteine O-methyltransferase Ste14
MQAGNGYWEEPDLAGRAGGHRGRDHRSIILSTLIISEDHQLITHGNYRFTRNPMYLGGIMVFTGLPVYAASLYGFLTSLVLTPIILNRIRLEEELLREEFQDAYQKYKKATKKTDSIHLLR